MDRKMVNFIKEQYPPGTRIRLNAMDDPYAPILPGTEGEVDFVDDAGQLHMKWDSCGASEQYNDLFHQRRIHLLWQLTAVDGQHIVIIPIVTIVRRLAHWY